MDEARITRQVHGARIYALRLILRCVISQYSENPGYTASPRVNIPPIHATRASLAKPLYFMSTRAHMLLLKKVCFASEVRQGRKRYKEKDS